MSRKPSLNPISLTYTSIFETWSFSGKAHLILQITKRSLNMNDLTLFINRYQYIYRTPTFSTNSPLYFRNPQRLVNIIHNAFIISLWVTHNFTTHNLYTYKYPCDASKTESYCVIVFHCPQFQQTSTASSFNSHCNRVLSRAYYHISCARTFPPNPTLFYDTLILSDSTAVIQHITKPLYKRKILPHHTKYPTIFYALSQMQN